MGGEGLHGVIPSPLELDRRHTPLYILEAPTCFWIYIRETSHDIDHMSVLVWPIRTTGSWVYLAGSWREVTPYVIVNIN